MTLDKDIIKQMEHNRAISIAHMSEVMAVKSPEEVQAMAEAVKDFSETERQVMHVLATAIGYAFEDMPDMKNEFVEWVKANYPMVYSIIQRGTTVAMLAAATKN